ncbi:MAG: DUF3850 domain-containing protein [Gammaproteobacteria bacterium]|nr:DUF3850 domain-containing protein [Gammaproteobacteria bacterium]
MEKEMQEFIDKWKVMFDFFVENHTIIMLINDMKEVVQLINNMKNEDDLKVITHILKTDPVHLEKSWQNIEQFELKKSDKDFEVGQRIILTETHYTYNDVKKEKPLEFTSRLAYQGIIHISGGTPDKLHGWFLIGTEFEMNAFEDDFQSFTEKVYEENKKILSGKAV